MSIKDPIKTTVEEIRKVLDLDNVVGKTIETDELLMIHLQEWVWDSEQEWVNPVAVTNLVD